MYIYLISCCYTRSWRARANQSDFTTWTWMFNTVIIGCKNVLARARAYAAVIYRADKAAPVENTRLKTTRSRWLLASGDSTTMRWSKPRETCESRLAFPYEKAKALENSIVANRPRRIPRGCRDLAYACMREAARLQQRGTDAPDLRASSPSRRLTDCTVVGYSRLFARDFLGRNSHSAVGYFGIQFWASSRSS